MSGWNAKQTVINHRYGWEELYLFVRCASGGLTRLVTCVVTICIKPPHVQNTSNCYTTLIYCKYYHRVFYNETIPANGGVAAEV
jgi:hypothetical protein